MPVRALPYGGFIPPIVESSVIHPLPVLMALEHTRTTIHQLLPLYPYTWAPGGPPRPARGPGPWGIYPASIRDLGLQQANIRQKVKAKI